MSNDVLAGVRAKVERAKQQISDLDTEIGAFVDGCGFEIASRYEPNADEQIWSFKLGKSVPLHLAVLTGEVLHNLRSALDQATCLIAAHHAGSTKDVYFPFGRTTELFEQQLQQKCKKLPEEAVDVIRKARPFPEGDAMLWLLHDLNRSDKHIDLIPVNLRTENNNASYLTVRTVLALVLGSRAAQHLIVERRSKEEIEAMPSPTAIYRTPPGTCIQFGTVGCSPGESLDFLVTTPGATFETDMSPVFSLVLAREGVVASEPVTSVLQQMSTSVVNVLDEFDTRIFAK